MLFRVPLSVTQRCSPRQYYRNIAKAATSALSVPESLNKEIAFNRMNKSSTFKASFSSIAGLQNKRAYPSHYIFGETAVLVVKPIMPKFQSVGQDGSIIKVSQQGKMLFQFSPSTRSGVQWNNQVSFALSAEEVGLLINQLPFHDVKFTRKLVSGHGNGMNRERYNLVSDDDDGVFKTLSATPIEGASILFEIDYKKDGVGAQIPPPDSNEENWSHAPMSIIIMAGEWEVLRSIFQDSLSSLLGWKAMMDIATANELANRS